MNFKKEMSMLITSHRISQILVPRLLLSLKYTLLKPCLDKSLLLFTFTHTLMHQTSKPSHPTQAPSARNHISFAL